MENYTLDNFLQKYSQRDLQQGEFELENERILELNLNGDVWVKMGSMVAYRGEVSFTREGFLDRGLGTLLKRTVSGEGGSLTKASGVGKVYLADRGKKIVVLNLHNESLFVSGSDLLAFQPSVQYEIHMLKRVASMMAGGLFNVELSGKGLVAIGTYFDPLVLEVTPGSPVVTDPGATVAWSGGLSPEVKVDVSLKTFLGRGSGESVQMRFEGRGFVIVQPVEGVVAPQA